MKRQLHVELDFEILHDAAVFLLADLKAGLGDLVARHNRNEATLQATFPGRQVLTYPAPEHLFRIEVRDLGLSDRVRNMLRRARVQTVRELVDRTEEDLLNIPQFGPIALNEVVDRLREMGLMLRREPKFPET